jgi:hypothetical protein
MSGPPGFVDPLLTWKKQHGNEIERVAATDIYMGKIGDLPVTPFCEKAQLDALKNEFVVREGDVWLVTYLKSGTTLTQEILKFFLGLG